MIAESREGKKEGGIEAERRESIREFWKEKKGDKIEISGRKFKDIDRADADKHGLNCALKRIMEED